MQHRPVHVSWIEEAPYITLHFPPLRRPHQRSRSSPRLSLTQPTRNLTRLSRGPVPTHSGVGAAGLVLPLNLESAALGPRWMRSHSGELYVGRAFGGIGRWPLIKSAMRAIGYRKILGKLLAAREDHQDEGEA